ncbi:thiolase family protein [Companilactobacillus metriopterae]|uniref:thiolase family protein n=1 Tax=Companilactobacillus metriopterae TaxID=1909267 RepID=UPI00100A23FC|nr:acetyl-CoA C-acetyltransferase [Companilactobacillus metriopterae]
MNKKVYIVNGYRTPIGKMGGILSSYTAVDLGKLVIEYLTKKSGVPLDAIDEVYMGNVIQAGNGQNPARQAAVNAGLPVTVPATTINAVCGSGLHSINMAAKLIQLGDIDVAIAGGMESMTNSPYLLKKARFGYRLGNGELVDSLNNDALMDAFNNYHMGITAENIVDKYGLTKHELNIFSMESQEKAINAQKKGLFTHEIIPLKFFDNRTKSNILIDIDENPREGLSITKLDKMKPAFKENGQVTAANSSGINDGAAGVLLASEEAVKKYKLNPVAVWNYGTLVGVEPKLMGLGPIDAVNKVLKKEQKEVNDIDLFEINEAFAAQSIPVIKELQIDKGKVNVNGGAIALGHPVGASGARILVTLIHSLIFNNKKFGVATLCIGGGMGCATSIEIINNK